MSDGEWKTAITSCEANNIRIRGYRITDLMGAVGFAQALYLLCRGDLPTLDQARMLEAILVSCVDHGIVPTSTRAARTVAASGSPALSALAAGILGFSDAHGGAIEGAMRLLHEVRWKWERKMGTLPELTRQVVLRALETQERLPGLGHAIYKRGDPRTERLLELAQRCGIAGQYVEIAEAYRSALSEELGKASLPLNVDGCIAALLCEMGFAPEVGNLFFALSRTAGFMAHIQEERQRERPLRDIDWQRAEYDGPEARELPEGASAVWPQ